MNIDDTLTRAFTDLKIVGKIKKENLLNNLGVDNNMKLYSHTKAKRQYDSRTSSDRYLKLIVCTGYKTIKGDFDLKTHNKYLYSYGKLE
jgi:glycyl-tRNA synthetase (class II)